MHPSPDLVRTIFEQSLDAFIANETQEVLDGVNERNNCGRMAIYLQRIADDSGLGGYFADMEYNRKQNGEVKTILDGEWKVIIVNCDLILHSRGRNLDADNLIAVEVKKREGRADWKTKDRERLCALTKRSFNDIWTNDGVTSPEHVCGYILGVYIELDRRRRQCLVEYYRLGNKFEETIRAF